MNQVNDELSALQPASFRGIRFPVTSRSHSVSQNAQRSVVVYRDGEYVEVFGLEGRKFTYQVPVRSGIATSGYVRLFAQLQAFFDAFRDVSAGPLIDPVYGEILATPDSWTDELTAMLRDGVDVVISFTEHTPLGEETRNQPAMLTNIGTANAQMDAAVEAVPWTVQTQPETEGTDPLSAAAGVINQVDYARDSFDAQILAVGSKAGKVERAAERLGLAAEPARRAARKLRLDCEKTAAAPPRDKAGTLVEIAADSPKTLMQLAAESGMTIEELLRADMTMARSALVPSGRRVWRRPPPRSA